MTKELLNNLLETGISPEDAKKQLNLLRRGTKTISLSSSASIGDGIHKLNKDEVQRLADYYVSEKEALKVLKFVPASGAASRMFKDLLTEYKEGQSSDASRRFKSGFQDLAMFNHLVPPVAEEDLFTLLFEEWSVHNVPKGTIPFHHYPDGNRTAFEEHLVEGITYASSQDMVHLHFTISPDHLKDIKIMMDSWARHYGEKHSVKFDISFSVQDPKTDTFALDKDGVVVRTSTGEVLQRPGGHGSLIHNLDKMDADLIFIKNIDNVAPDHLKHDTLLYKKALAGFLLEARAEAKEVLSDLKDSDDDWVISKARKLLVRFGVDIDSEKIVSKETLIGLLDRPFRVCGMVRNQGEPGGGPFWVQRSGYRTLQIVESAQVNHDDPDQWRKLKEGTFFNPVDLVCYTKDLDEKPRSILPFVDPEAAFVTNKSYEGHDITVLEWPGLWNGAMADWNTLFIEVPISTFTPVKTVNDLFRLSHSSEA